MQVLTIYHDIGRLGSTKTVRKVYLHSLHILALSPRILIPLPMPSVGPATKIFSIILIEIVTTLVSI